MVLSRYVGRSSKSRYALEKVFLSCDDFAPCKFLGTKCYVDVMLYVFQDIYEDEDDRVMSRDSINHSLEGRHCPSGQKQGRQHALRLRSNHDVRLAWKMAGEMAGESRTGRAQIRSFWSKYDVYTVSHLYELTTHSLPILSGPRSSVFRPYFADPDPELPSIVKEESIALVEAISETVTARLEDFFKHRHLRFLGRKLVFPSGYFPEAGRKAARILAREDGDLETAVMKVYVETADLSSVLIGQVNFSDQPVSQSETSAELILIVQEEWKPSGESWMAKRLRRVFGRFASPLVVQEEVHLSKRSRLGGEIRSGLDQEGTLSSAGESWRSALKSTNGSGDFNAGKKVSEVKENKHNAAGQQ